MSLDYIRNYYNLKIKRGDKVKYTCHNEILYGTITGSKNSYIRVRFENESKSKLFHPLDENLEYIVEKDHGISVLVDGKIVAWFAEWDEETRDWCSKHYFGKWLTWKATIPKLIPLSKEEYNNVKKSAKEMSKKFKNKELSC